MTVALPTIDWDRGLITDATGARSALRAQSLAVLKELHDRAGTLVSKEELIGKIWSGVAVTDDSLVQCIAELRRALRDEGHTIIKTITKRGYLLERSQLGSSAPTNASSNDQAAQSAIGENAQHQTPPQASIAVLPFSNLSGDPEQEFFVDGLTEDIITDISNTPGLFVIARNSSFAYKGKAQDIRQIASDLGVKYILEGSVRKSSQRLRINVQLNDAEGGSPVWAERFDRDIEDVFALQDEVTARIVRSITGKLVQTLSEKQIPKTVEAYELYLRGRHLSGMSQTGSAQGKIFLERAIELDPDYAAPLAELAVSLRMDWLIWGTAAEDNGAEASRLTEKAFSLSPSDSEVLFRCGWIALSQKKYDEARQHFETALSMNPNDADSWMGIADFHVLTGDQEEAVTCSGEALRLNPTPPSWYYLIIGNALIGAGHYSKAVEVLGKDIEAHEVSRRLLAVALLKLGRESEAKEQARLFLEFAPRWRAGPFVARRGFKHASDSDWWVAAYAEAGLPI